jgi:tryptophanyl-tRNA synthetase
MDLQEPAKKMSTTNGTPQGTVLVLDDPDTIRKKFKTAVTDSGREIRYAPAEKPGVSNLIEILSVASGRAIADVEADYGGKGYGDLKTGVGEAVVELFRPMQERYHELRADEGELRRLLQIGAEKAKDTAHPTLEKMYGRMGFVR